MPTIQRYAPDRFWVVATCMISERSAAQISPFCIAELMSVPISSSCDFPPTLTAVADSVGGNEAAAAVLRVI